MLHDSCSKEFPKVRERSWEKGRSKFLTYMWKKYHLSINAWYHAVYFTYGKVTNIL